MDTAEIRRIITSGQGLPGLPQVALEALRCAADSPHAPRQVAALAAADPGLKNRLLMEASSCEEGIPVTGVDSAADRLGLAGLRGAIFRHVAMSLFPPEESRRLDRETFWRHSFVCGAFAERLALRIKSRYAGDAYVAGLLHDLGKPVLDLVAPEGYSKAMDMAHAQGIFVLEAERRELGVDHTLAGKWLAEFWGLPEHYAAAIWLHHHPPGALDHTQYPLELVDIVALADAMAHDHLAGHLETGDFRSVTEDRRQRLGLERGDLLEIAGESLDRSQDAPPAAGTPILPGQGVPDVEGLRAQRRFLRYRAMHEMNTRLTLSMDPGSVLRIVVDALRGAFSIPAGCCCAEGESGVSMEGLVWQDLESPAQPFHFSGGPEHPTGPIEPGAARMLDELLRGQGDAMDAGLQQAFFRQGFVAVPFPADGHSVGRIIFDVERSGLKPQEDDMGDLLAFAAAAGAALKRCRQAYHQETQTEELATALWKQELHHRQHVRQERLVSVAQLAAGAAHEINNPLAVISGRAQIMLTRTTAPDDLKALETIIQQTRRINKILNDLLQFARPSEPRLEPSLVSFVLHQVISMLRDRLEARGIKIVEQYAHGLPRAPLDRRQMEQVFLNLIVNAEQAMAHHPGTLTLAVKPSRDRKSIIVQISDTGHGIPPGIMDRIFEPFFTTRQTGETTGLGLAVCHGIIENHRGSITLHSAEGEGATCTITLPSLAESTAESSRHETGASATARPVPPAPPAVLLADRDEDFREVMRQALQTRGYTVRLAEDALETVAAVMGHPIDIIILDLRLPPLEETSLLRELRKRFPSVPIIATAGAAAGEEIDDTLRHGARAVLRKPFEIERLLNEIRQALGAAHRTQTVA
jgi:signal transduction histidine kinase/HD-like signal output (HDOD) protein/ActR/RegA family two-component response regulator